MLEGFRPVVSGVQGVPQVSVWPGRLVWNKAALELWRAAGPFARLHVLENADRTVLAFQPAGARATRPAPVRRTATMMTVDDERTMDAVLALLPRDVRPRARGNTTVVARARLDWHERGAYFTVPLSRFVRVRLAARGKDKVAA